MKRPAAFKGWTLGDYVAIGVGLVVCLASVLL